jgi:hypothetical protein
MTTSDNWSRFLDGQYVKQDLKEPLYNLRWYYQDLMRNAHVHNEKCRDVDNATLVENPKNHKQIMDQYKLWCPEMITWLDDNDLFCSTKLTRDQKEAVRRYTGDFWFKHVWAWYEENRPVQDKFSHKYDDEKEFSHLSHFDSVWKQSLHLPRGAILFEGQGFNEMDFIEKKGDQSIMGIKIGAKFIRKRPSSTSWSLNAATWFIDARKDNGVLLVHQVDSDNLPAINVQSMVSRGFGSTWLECEVLVQPGIEIEVVDITEWRLESYNKNRSSMLSWSETIKVIRTKIRNLS